MTQEDAIKELVYFTDEIEQTAKAIFVYCTITIPLLIVTLIYL